MCIFMLFSIAVCIYYIFWLTDCLFIDSNAVFVVAGDGYLQQKIIDAALTTKCIKYIGPVRSHDAPSLLAARYVEVRWVKNWKFFIHVNTASLRDWCSCFVDYIYSFLYILYTCSIGSVSPPCLYLVNRSKSLQFNQSLKVAPI